MNGDPVSLVARDVWRRFGRAAGTFDRADFVHRKTFDAMLERLAPANIEPRTILDLGCATGTGSRLLARKFRRTRVLAFDRSFRMLRKVGEKQSFLLKLYALQGNAACLPLQDGSIDLVFANMLLPWLDNPVTCLSEVARVLRKGGVFAFSTLGPDSFAVMREAWRSIDDEVHVGEFADMHVTGDALIQAGLRDPVLDVDRLTVSYRDVHALFRDLGNAGARNCLAGRRPTLTGKGRFNSLIDELSSRMRDGVLSLELELVYGHAWGGGPQQAAGEFRFDPGAITRRSQRD